MFDAEDQKMIGDDNWESFLQKVLANDFTIRRSNSSLSNQNREQMIDWIKQHPVTARNLLKDEVVSWCDETLGVVTSPLTMMRDDNKLHRYQNTKVFTKQSQNGPFGFGWSLALPLTRSVNCYDIRYTFQTGIIKKYG